MEKQRGLDPVKAHNILAELWCDQYGVKLKSVSVRRKDEAATDNNIADTGNNDTSAS